MSKQIGRSASVGGAREAPKRREPPNKYKPGYKETKCGWIPEDWECTKLEEISSKITKGTTPTTYGMEYQKAGIKFIKIENIGSNNSIINESIQYISVEANNFMERSKVKVGDILFSIAGALGKTAIINTHDIPANINQALALIRIKRNSNNTLNYIINHLNSEILSKEIKMISVRQAQTNLSLKQIRNFPIPLPPKNEQENIAEILGTWDKAIEQVEQLIEVKEKLKKGLMQQLLTGRMRFPEFGKPVKEKGEVPEGWRRINVKKAIKILIPPTKLKSGQYLKEGKYIVVDQSDNYYIAKTDKKSNLVKFEGCVIVFGDHTCTVKILSENFAQGADGIKIFKLNTRRETEWFYYYLTAFPIKQQGYMRHFKYVKESKFLVPKNDGETAKILKTLDLIDKDTKSLLELVQNYKSQKKGLMQKLLTGEIRV